MPLQCYHTDQSPLDVSPFVQDEFVSKLVPDARAVYGSEDWGTYLLQELKDPDNSIRLCWVKVEKEQELLFSFETGPYVACMAVSGQVMVHFDSCPAQLFHPGEFNIYPCSSRNVWLTFYGGQNCELLFVSYCEERMAHFAQSFPQLAVLTQRDRQAPKAPLYEKPFPFPPKIYTISQLLYSQRYGSGQQSIFLEIIAGCLLFQLLQGDPQSMKEAMAVAPYIKSRVIRAREIVDAQRPVRMLVKDLAAEVGLNEHQLGDGFKKTVGTTILQYILNHNMQLAKEWLEEGKSVKVVMKNLDYKSKSSFIRTFKDKIGLLPGKIKPLR